MLVLGIDYSSERSGFTVMDDYCNIYHLQSVNFYKNTKKERRLIIGSVVQEICDQHKIDFILLENIRLFSKGIINLKTIVSLASVVVTICNSVEIPIYGIDTRSWKKRVLGSAKADKDDAIKHAGIIYNIDVKGNHDLADSICIAEMGARFGLSDLLKKID